MAEFKDKMEDYIKRMLNLPKNNIKAVKKISKKFFMNANVVEGIEKVFNKFTNDYLT